MLRSLSIRNVVLIEKLDIDFQPGLCVLTGETGAGKSILLDALGLALGVRAESRLVRQGAERAQVTADFDLPHNHPAFGILAEQDIDAQGELILRRTLTTDGRSKAYVNDQTVSVGLLKRLGETLVEIHGQFETQGLLNASVHRSLVDAYGGLEGDSQKTGKCYKAWRAAQTIRREAEAALAKAQEEEEYLRHVADELSKLAPEPGEEEELAKQRSMMMHGEKLMEALNSAATEMNRNHGVEAAIRGAIRHLERIAEKADGRAEPIIEALDRAALEVSDAMTELNRGLSEIDLDPRHLEAVEERLFALKAAARKHNTTVDALPALKDQFVSQIAALEDGGSNLEKLRADEKAAKGAYIAAARVLSRKRTDIGAKLDTAVMAELAPLKLEKAKFASVIEPLEEPDWNEHGCDRVSFQIATNPGAPLGPISKIASGGELARFMLALKVVLAQADPVPTLIFDEVDAGTGGAVAAAVGERLARLGAAVQVFVVTHAPQVAAKGDHHWRISKGLQAGGGEVVTSVEPLAESERLDEVARMLAGAQLTDEARAAADSLLKGRRS